MVAGVDYKRALDVMRDHITHVHVKDCYEINGKMDIVWIGSGVIDYRWVLAELAKIGYDGDFALEYEMNVEPPPSPWASGWTGSRSSSRGRRSSHKPGRLRCHRGRLKMHRSLPLGGAAWLHRRVTMGWESLRRLFPLAAVILAVTTAAAPGPSPRPGSTPRRNRLPGSTPPPSTVTPLPNAPPSVSATPVAHATPDAGFARALAPQLQGSYRSGASDDEVVALASAAVRRYFGVEPGRVYAAGGGALLLVTAYPKVGETWTYVSYLFWRDSAGSVQFQAIDPNLDQSRTVGWLFAMPPQELRMSLWPAPEMAVIPNNGLMGQDYGGGFALLRLEHGMWRVTWSYQEAAGAGLWGTRGAEARFVGIAPDVMLLGSVPEAEPAPRFFNESLHHAYQQQFMSLSAAPGR